MTLRREQLITGSHASEHDVPITHHFDFFKGLKHQDHKVLHCFGHDNTQTIETLKDHTGLSVEELHSSLDNLIKLELIHKISDKPETYHLNTEVINLHHPKDKQDSFQYIRKTLVKGMGQFISMRIVSITMTYIFQILIARWMGTDDYGFYNIVITLAVVLSYLAALGFPTAMQKFLPQYQLAHEWGKYHGLIHRGIQIALFLGLTILLAAAPFIYFESMTAHKKWIFLFGLILVPVLAFSNVIAAILSAKKKWFVTFFPEMVFQPVLFVGIGLAMRLYHGYLNAEHLIFSMLATQVATLILQLSYFGRELPKEGRKSKPEFITKKWLKTALPVLLMTAFLIVMNRADLLLVGFIMGSKSAGVYAAVLTTSELIQIFYKAAINVSNPMIAPMFHKKDMVSLQYLMSHAVRYSAIPCIIIAVLMAVFGHEILRLFGDDFVHGYWPLVIMLGTQVIKVSFGTAGYFLVMTGHQMDIARVYSITVVLDVALIAILTKFFGLPGAALGSMLAMLASCFLLFYKAKKRTGINTSVFSRGKLAPEGA